MDDVLGMYQRVKQVLIKAFITQLSIKAFDESILHGLTGCDVMPIDLPSI